MTSIRRVTYLLGAILAIVILPWLGAYIHHGGHFPSGYFSYPPLAPGYKAPFDPFLFGLVSVVFALVAAVYFFPQLFGFQKVPQPARPPVRKVGFPIWFWVGLVAWGSAMFLLWMKSTRPVWLLHWSDLPLFWGFTLMIDGWVYVRQGGRSLVSEVPQEVVGIGASSVLGWMVFEYLNFFIDDNWYYPWGNIVSREMFLLYAIVISSGLLPLAFVWYSLFKTIPALRNRFTLGRKFVLPGWAKNVILVSSLTGLLGAGLFPDYLFFSLWLSPAVLLAVVLNKAKVWTPLDSIGQGNWTPTLLAALTYLAEGVCIEGQNYFSAVHDGQKVLFTEAPAYWQYSLPYVNAYHLFEMPILGFLGYMPFGIYCWVWWIAFATIQGIPSRFYKEELFDGNVVDQ